MKIAIIGAGAIGSLLGGIWAREGQDVTLIGQKAHMQAVDQNGLMVDGVMGKFTVSVKTAERLNFTPDLAFLTAKSQDVEALCRMIKPHVADIPVVATQNGIRSIHEAGSILGKENIIGCILLLNARFLDPGRVTYIKRNPIVTGEVFSPNKERIKTVQSLLCKVAETFITHNFIGAQWTKLFINAMSNSIDAMTGFSQEDVVKHPSLIKIGVWILKEALQVVEKANLKMEKLPGVPITMFKRIIKMPTPIATFVMKRVIQSKGDPDIITSTLQSIRKGKMTEIDYLNGEFVKLGLQVGIPTPYNSTAVELIHEVEKTQNFFTPQDLAKRFSFDK